MAIGIDLKGAGEVMSGAGQFIKDIRAAITGKDPDKMAELALRAQEIEAGLQTAQVELMKVEAASTNMFIAGARPAIMWIGALVIFYVYILAPVLETFGLPRPNIQVGDLWPVITGVLGLGTMRTYEKSHGVVDKH